ncbi:hypothetical protein P4S72_14740, partial [Vibrio sp. PP-XX7]
DRVVMSFNSCGHCPSCQHEAPTYCYEFMSYNWGVPARMGRQPSWLTTSRCMPTSSASPVSPPMRLPIKEMSSVSLTGLRISRWNASLR